MKRNLKKVVLVLALLLPGVIKAQEFNVTAKADFVSDYIWRGAYQNSGFSPQRILVFCILGLAFCWSGLFSVYLCCLMPFWKKKKAGLLFSEGFGC